MFKVRHFSVVGLFLIGSFVSSVAFSGLEEDVDALTPDQAYRIIRKLEAKQLQPIPESYFTKMAVLFGGSYRFASPDAFNSSINSAFSDFGNLGALDVSVLWNLSDCFSFGFGFGLAGKKPSFRDFLLAISEDSNIENYQSYLNY